MRRNQMLATTAVISGLLLLNSCAAIGGIFKAGVWTGILLVVIIVVVIIYIISRSRGNNNS